MLTPTVEEMELPSTGSQKYVTKSYKYPWMTSPDMLHMPTLEHRHTPRVSVMDTQPHRALHPSGPTDESTH